MSDFSRHRPLVSRQDLSPSERKGARRATVWGVAAFAVIGVAIVVLIQVSPVQPGAIAMLGP